MLLLTKKGLKPFDLNDFTKVGIDVFFLEDEMTELELIVECTKKSKGEIRRLIKQGGVWLGNEKVTDPEALISKGNVAMTLFIGKDFQNIIV